ncbi:putative U6 snRNA-associated-like-Sm protein LSm4 [Rhizoctonia solani 123E]|uniref:LSM complex subunit LSM4 n=1 Tax=Rhizoctonia solani 123E TaxID=1423351 RepID=A0A074SD80_9AGAM|nr:putative U6 snRNA-associated-like-Sm protein LSm4 [Rhizoctonia solani 123E]
MLVELKNGETFNGHLVNCDTFMNITLREVYQTSPEGDRFWKLKECYIRGSMIKYLRVPDALLDSVKEEQLRARDANRGRGGAPGGNRGMFLSHMLWITPNPISRRTRCSTKGW